MIIAQQTHTLIELDVIETLTFRELLVLIRNIPENQIPSEHMRLIMELLAKLPH